MFVEVSELSNLVTRRLRDTRFRSNDGQNYEDDLVSIRVDRCTTKTYENVILMSHLSNRDSSIPAVSDFTNDRLRSIFSNG